jgi:hypothetical protein
MAEVERENFKFPINDLGIKSTKTFMDIGESLLDSDPDDIQVLDKKEEETDEEKEKKEKEAKLAAQKKLQAKQTNTQTQTQNTPTEQTIKEIGEDDFFAELDENGDSNKSKTVKKDNKGTETEVEEDIILTLQGQKEKQQEKNKSPEETTEEADNNNTSEETNIYLAVAEEMVNQGIFEPDEDEKGNQKTPNITTPEELLQRFQDSSRRIASEYLENYLDSRGQEARDIFDNIIAKGVDPKEYINRYAKIQDFKTLDLTNEDNQEKVVRELYRSEGRSADYIEKKMAQHRNYNDLQSESEEAQRILVAKEEQSIVNAAKEKEVQEQRDLQIKTQYINSLAKILNEKAKIKEFDGIEVTREVAINTYNYLTQDRYKIGKDNKLITEFDKDILELQRPENHEMKVKLALIFQMLKVDPKLSTIKKNAISKESNEVFKGLKQRNIKAGVSSNKTTNNTNSSQTQEKEVSSSKSWF